MSTSISFITSYTKIFQDNGLDPTLYGSDMYPLPQFSEAQYESLFDETIRNLSNNLSLITLNPPVVIFGDIHGNIFDLIRLFKTYPPSSYKLLFLGDYVDRGEYSIETLGLLCAMSCQNIGSVFFLRGNHETPDCGDVYGLREHLKSVFGKDTLYEKVMELFSYMPIAANIGDEYFCVHGGISEKLLSVRMIQKIPLPINPQMPSHFTELVTDLLWSDPCQKTKLYAESYRGKGKLFGYEAVDRFLTLNKMKAVIRAHQFVEYGIRTNFDNKVYTIFSSSNYRPGKESPAGVILIDPAGKLTTRVLAPNICRQRKDVKFYEPKIPTLRVLHVGQAIQRHPSMGSSLSIRSKTTFKTAAIRGIIRAKRNSECITDVARIVPIIS